MVAISLYRGNLHRVPDVPRRWMMPERSISFKNFQFLLRRRSVALSRHFPSSTSNPSPNPNNLGDASDRPGSSVERTGVGIRSEGTSGAVASEEVNGKVEDPKVSATDEILKKNVGDSSLVADVTKKDSSPVNDIAKTQLAQVAKPEEPLNVKSKTTEKGEDSTEREKRKRKVEEKLQVLTAKKHTLVQVLKQILNAEEDLKRRSSTQGTDMRPAISLQVDVTYDAESMAIKHSTPKAGTEVNQAGYAGGEANDGSNHNMLSQQLPSVSNTSPSPESALGKPALSQLNLVAHPARANLAATSTGSPSRFAPQGQPSHPAAVSLFGTNYVISSPSPAASGGTSVFKDAAR